MIEEKVVSALRKAALDEVSLKQLVEIVINNLEVAEASWQQVAVHFVAAFDVPIKEAKNIARLDSFESGSEDESAVAPDIMPYVERYREQNTL